MYVNYVAHLLHNYAMRGVRAHFKNIDEVITIKAATIKNKDRKKVASLPSPPDPVITRWATWLRAALYHSEPF